MKPRAHVCSCRRQEGSAIAETLVALLALAPFLIGIPLLGKQADIKHKAFDATRYAVWERTVWRNDGASHRKSEEDIALEARDRILGDPSTYLVDAQSLRVDGITENRFWVDRRRQRLVHYRDEAAAIEQVIDAGTAPVEVGYFFVPGISYGEGVASEVAGLLRVSDLDLNRRAFARASTRIDVRPALSHMADSPRRFGTPRAAEEQHMDLVHEAAGSILSDTWSTTSEDDLRRRVDYVTTNELIEFLEAPARAIGALALGRGRPLYGEGQFAWEPELRPNSSDLPAAYIERR